MTYQEEEKAFTNFSEAKRYAVEQISNAIQPEIYDAEKLATALNKMSKSELSDLSADDLWKLAEK